MEFPLNNPKSILKSLLRGNSKMYVGHIAFNLYMDGNSISYISRLFNLEKKQIRKMIKTELHRKSIHG